MSVFSQVKSNDSSMKMYIQEWELHNKNNLEIMSWLPDLKYLYPNIKNRI